VTKMSTSETTQRERVRVFATGSCEGFEKLRDSLAGHPELELVGATPNVADGAAALAGGHLDAVLHATRSASLPADELAAIREHTRAPVLVVASSGSSRMLEEALDATTGTGARVCSRLAASSSAGRLALRVAWRTASRCPPACAAAPPGTQRRAPTSPTSG